MKDITGINLIALASTRRDVIYNCDGRSVPYAKVEIGVVKNPYTGKIEIGVCPYAKNEFGEIFLLYSYAEDLQYQYCMDVARECVFKNIPIPTDVDTFARALIKKKEFARKQADEYISQQLQLPIDKVSSAYARAEWREDVVNSEAAKQLLEEYYKTRK